MVDALASSDQQLLKAFVDARSEEAFAELVRRHGPMVLGVCRRVAGHAEDAEDAFQATFLVLARRAASLEPALLGNWLYGVAYRTALKSRTTAGRRRGKEQNMPTLPEAVEWPKAVDRELVGLLDAALARLPSKYRAAVVLCDLEQQPRREAAAILQIPEGTLSSRLAAGRKMLADGLRKRGVTLSVGALGVALSILSRMAPAETLVASTAQAAVSFAAGGAVGVASASSGAVTLAQGVLKMMVIKKIAVALVVFASGASLIGVGAAVYGSRDAEPDAALVIAKDQQQEEAGDTLKAAGADANVAAKPADTKNDNDQVSNDDKEDDKKPEDQKKEEPKLDARQAVHKALEGVWLAQSAEDHGKVRDVEGYQMIFNKGKFTLRPPAGKEQELSGRYEIDPAKGPQIIDFIVEKDGKRMLAIFEAKGDDLRICMNEVPEGERPDRFVSEKRGKNDLLMVFKRKAARETK